MRRNLNLVARSFYEMRHNFQHMFYTYENIVFEAQKIPEEIVSGDFIFNSNRNCHTSAAYPNQIDNSSRTLIKDLSIGLRLPAALFNGT